MANKKIKIQKYCKKLNMKQGKNMKYNIFNNLHFHKQNTMKRDKNQNKKMHEALYNLCV